GIHFAICCLAMIIGSLTSDKAPEADLEKTVWSVRSYRAETAKLAEEPWYKNYRIQGVILVIIVIIILIVY
ncbi:MAG: hypothetical protein R3345_12990, partial [Fulvivirga sp.]|nr:hypothetical protein [Fulvivirga sp.]